MMNRAQQIAAKLRTPFKPGPFCLPPASRLPEEYKKFWREWHETVPQPVHYIPQLDRWEKNEFGEMKRVENVPLPGFIPKELNNIITGGEMVLQGFVQRHKKARRIPKFWMPSARQSVIYSEVLNKHISVLITERAIDLIMQHQGFDKYVLSTRACDLGTTLALKLKRNILLALRDNTLPYDKEKNEIIVNKYKPYMIPPQEIEWYGLTLHEATQKLIEIEKEEQAKSLKPLKHLYRIDFINELKIEQKMDKLTKTN